MQLSQSMEKKKLDWSEMQNVYLVLANIRLRSPPNPMLQEKHSISD